MDTNKKMREYISAFADGELPDTDLELALAALREADGRETWDLYHRIGDALRDQPEATGAAALSPGFGPRLAERLAAEATPLRRATGRPVTPADALAAIAPAVVAGGDALKGGKLGGPSVAPRDGPAAEPAPTVVKRL